MTLLFLGFLLADFLVNSTLLVLSSTVGTRTQDILPLDIKLGNARLIKEDCPFRSLDNIAGGQWRQGLREHLAHILVVDIVAHPNKLLTFIADC